MVYNVLRYNTALLCFILKYIIWRWNSCMPTRFWRRGCGKTGIDRGNLHYVWIWKKMVPSVQETVSFWISSAPRCVAIARCLLWSPIPPGGRCDLGHTTSESQRHRQPSKGTTATATCNDQGFSGFSPKNRRPVESSDLPPCFLIKGAVLSKKWYGIYGSIIWYVWTNLSKESCHEQTWVGANYVQVQVFRFNHFQRAVTHTCAPQISRAVCMLDHVGMPWFQPWAILLLR